MCGIVGYFSSSASRPDCSRSLAGLRHRGPDRQGDWTSPDGSVWLGHTRLAILDLTEAGDQPMRDEVTGNAIVFNGEIYNHLSLRKELVNLGVAFCGHSDTETLLRGYGVWGTAIFPRLDGMFACAIYNERSREVVFGRDRFGIKPLYMGRTPTGDLVFGSEVRALLPWTGNKLSREGLAAYLHWGANSHGCLLFENMSEFPAGCWASYRAPHRSLAPVRYWPVAQEAEIFLEGSGGGSRDPAAEVRALLEAAVESHLLSDVPVACFLSGGIDSSILAALASQRLGRGKLATFSVGFAEKGFDETQFAKQMAELYGTDHHHIHLSQEDKLAFVEKAVGAMDLPSIDAINTFIVSSYVAQGGFKVVLSGLGADEIFGGYPIFRDFATVRAILSTPRWLQAWARAAGRGLHPFSDIPSDKNGEAMTRWWRRVWTGDQIAGIGLPRPCQSRDPSPPLRDAMAEVSWGEISHYMRDTLLRDSDAMSMAHSIEIRVPFLDNALVGKVLSYSAKEKFDPRLPKSLLLRATSDLLPEAIWNRPKMGFSLPMRDWMRGPLADYCQAGLDGLVREAVLDSRSRAQVWDGFTSGKRHWPMAWAAVVLGHYLNRLS